MTEHTTLSNLRPFIHSWCLKEEKNIFPFLLKYLTTFTKTEGKWVNLSHETPEGQQKSFSLITWLVKKTPLNSLITLDDNTTCTHVQVKLKYSAVLIARGIVHQFFAYLTEGNRTFKTSNQKFPWKAMHMCMKMEEYSAILWFGLHHIYWEPLIRNSLHICAWSLSLKIASVVFTGINRSISCEVPGMNVKSSCTLWEVYP